MKKIHLRNKDVYTMVDDEDFDSLNKLVWHSNRDGYAVRRNKINGRNKTIFMHRLIKNTPEKLYVDHINRVRLDNRKENLRNVTWQENRNNISIHKDNKNKERNIDFMKKNNRYRVRIQRNKHVVYEEFFKHLKEAVKGRDNYYSSNRI